MIGPKDLRIGNLVLSREVDLSNGNEIHVEAFVDLYILHELSRGNVVKQFSPIPLTPEWLERMGFKSNSLFPKSEWNLDTFKISQPESVKPNYFFSNYHWEASKEIQYAHQLQNLYFAMTGKELEIKPIEK